MVNIYPEITIFTAIDFDIIIDFQVIIVITHCEIPLKSNLYKRTTFNFHILKKRKNVHIHKTYIIAIIKIIKLAKNPFIAK